MAVTTIYKMVHQRRIPYVKIGRALTFNLDQVERWIQEQTVMPMTRR
ncbi:helix-turn-helix domain-containing protein [uncultured Nitrospira sp.]